MPKDYVIDMSEETRRDIIYHLVLHCAYVPWMSTTQRRNALDTLTTIATSMGSHKNNALGPYVGTSISQVAGDLIKVVFEKDINLYQQLDPFFYKHFKE